MLYFCIAGLSRKEECKKKSGESLPNAVAAGVDQDYQDQHCSHVVLSPDFLIVRASPGRLRRLRLDEISFFPEIVVEHAVQYQDCGEG